MLSTVGEDEDAVEDTDCPDLSPHGEGSPARGEPSSSSSSAKFWEALLKEKHEQLLKEEEQQVREQWQTSHLRHVDTSPALDAAGEFKHLHNVEMCFFSPQTFLSLDFQCRDDVSELK